SRCPQYTSLKIELPGDAEAIGAPSEPRREAVVVEWQETLTTRRERRECRLEFITRRAVNEQRHSRSERKCMLHRAVDEDERMAMQCRIGPLHGSFRSWFAGAIPFDALDSEPLSSLALEFHRCRWSAREQER